MDALIPNLILTGFMGTGKSTVGREVARRLGRPFVDMDAEVEARAGRPICEIFAEEGEGAFRALESELCAELGARRGLVIATGGGALIHPQNRAHMSASGTVVCLNCELDEILRRTSSQAEARPLLTGPRAGARMAQLLEARESAYHSIPWQIDTMGKSVDEVADEVEALAGVYSLTVRHSQGSYPVHLGTGLRHRLGHALRAVGVHPGSQVVVISNPTIASLYAQDVEVALRIADLVPSLCIIPDGEEHKSLVTVQDLYDQFLATGMDRSGTVLALGGGVIGDVAGFAAATFMRGVRFIQVPTSLLAMVDASVGGKTGVDLPQGKNLVGAFKQPALVLIDPEVLKTLMPVEFRSGMAEVIKYAIIADVGLFDALACGPAMNVDEEGLPVDLLVRVLRVKIDVVEADPFEEEMRATLNLGHTVGHALEQLSGYKLRHGEGVACGLVAAARLAEALDQAENGLAEEISAVLDEWGLPTCLPHYPIDIILEAMVHDKKRKRGSLRWILPRRVGKVEIVADVPRAVVEGVLRSMRECDAPEGETEC